MCTDDLTCGGDDMDGQKSIIKTKESFEAGFAQSDYYNKQSQDSSQLDKILCGLDIKENRKILDLGTGSGYLAFPIAVKNPDCQIVGLDIVAEALKKNKVKAAEQALSNIDFVSYDGNIFPFEDNTFDIIVTRYALHHFPDIIGAFREMSRVLKPGGQLFISDPTPNDSDRDRFVDAYMKMKDDGHIKYYTHEEFKIWRALSVWWPKKVSKQKLEFPRKTGKTHITACWPILTSPSALIIKFRCPMTKFLLRSLC